MGLGRHGWPQLNTPWLLNWFGCGAGDYFQCRASTPKVRRATSCRTREQQLVDTGWHQYCLRRRRLTASTAVPIYGLTGPCRLHRPDDGVGPQRGLRALLDPAVEDFTLRRLYVGEYNGQANNILCSLQGSGTGGWFFGACQRAATTTGPPGGLVPALSGT